MTLMRVDVKKAHLVPTCRDEVYVELPSEFAAHGRYAKLQQWLHGMRRAAQCWGDHYSERFEQEGFARGSAAPTVFQNSVTGVRVVVHGDDFTFSGTLNELASVREKMEKCYTMKHSGQRTGRNPRDRDLGSNSTLD